MAKARIPAIAYLRTSSAANVGSDKDSDTRQRQAISGFAKRASCASSSSRTSSRFARHLLTQEAGISLLVGLGVRVLTAAGDDQTDSDDEFRVAMRQIMGVFSQLEKTRLVKKLKAARDRRRANGKVEGRKSHLEARPEVVADASGSPKTGERSSLRKIAAELAALGHLNVNGRPYSAKSVRSMIEGPARARQNGRKPTHLTHKLSPVRQEAFDDASLLVRFTPIFCRPYTRRADRQPCATSGLTQRKKADPNSSPHPVVGLEVDDRLKICLDAGSVFSSHCPLDLAASEANVLKLPVAHCLQLDDRQPLDAPREVGHPPCSHGGDQGAAGPGAASFSCRRPKCRAHDHLPLLSLPRTTVGWLAGCQS
jgi:Resolvase, N terminal domain